MRAYDLLPNRNILSSEYISKLYVTKTVARVHSHLPNPFLSEMNIEMNA